MSLGTTRFYVNPYSSRGYICVLGCFYRLKKSSQIVLRQCDCIHIHTMLEAIKKRGPTYEAQRLILQKSVQCAHLRVTRDTGVSVDGKEDAGLLLSVFHTHVHTQTHTDTHFHIRCMFYVAVILGGHAEQENRIPFW